MMTLERATFVGTTIIICKSVGFHVPYPCADDASAEQLAAHGADQSFSAQHERMRFLSRALEKANKAGKPIVISRLPGSASSQDSAGTTCLTGDPALLLALQPKVHTSNYPAVPMPSSLRKAAERVLHCPLLHQTVSPDM